MAKTVSIEVKISKEQHDSTRFWESSVPGIKHRRSEFIPGVGYYFDAEGSRRAVRKACELFGLTDDQMDEVEEQLREQ